MWHVEVVYLVDDFWWSVVTIVHVWYCVLFLLICSICLTNVLMFGWVSKDIVVVIFLGWLICLSGMPAVY